MALQSFFEKLTGSQSYKEGNGEEDKKEEEQKPEKQKNNWLHSKNQGQLTIDVYQTPKEIIIKSPVAGSRPEDIDIAIENDMVTISGKREYETKISKEDYLYQEIYWGEFSRSVLLPQEVEASKAEAEFKNGLLTIRIPKIEKEKIQKIKIRVD
ncbi:MAG: hypothetical protein A3H02_01910 [Candidatus Niyogibacteria bacterium RIFCSPLOWO2_12_FULL_41_13]|uniref:SHSP domain-containing protein n=1 Tax=Candidatus Niyogibacteria bacterium RIFCSPLOWO2_12_FULL_41_13 TaxID=1801726 RepID=A0A1G2F193_9BACT|nr:MAG: hypothetical protein A3H02_01910 [Candidatus Niyogibacteria bacterium RIFCSPLOWO2_12_FULL_41_13]